MSAKLALPWFAVAALVLGSCSTPGLPGPDIRGTDHCVQRDGQRIHVWEKTAVDAATKRGVLVFIHGATWSSRPDFDLQIRDYSAMDAMARDGWDTFAIDVQGYGQSDDPVGDNWSRTADAAKDVAVAIEFICAQRGVDRVSLLGWSWGAQIAGLYANQRPERVARLILFGFMHQRLFPSRPGPTEKYRTNSADGAKSDFIEGCYEQDVVDFYVAECLRVDPVSPNGVRVDFLQHLPLVDPKKLPMPTMLLYGEHEVRGARLQDGMQFIAELAHPARRLVVLPGGGHAHHLEKNRHRWWRAVLGFFGD